MKSIIVIFRPFLLPLIITLLLTTIFAFWFFSKASEKISIHPTLSVTVNKSIETITPLAPIKAKYVCGQKTKCPQMKSCEEAQFYLNECGVKRLDYDKDTIPCEKTHCGTKN